MFTDIPSMFTDVSDVQESHSMLGGANVVGIALCARSHSTWRAAVCHLQFSNEYEILTGGHRKRTTLQLRSTDCAFQNLLIDSLVLH